MLLMDPEGHVVAFENADCLPASQRVNTLLYDGYIIKIVLAMSFGCLALNEDFIGLAWLKKNFGPLIYQRYQDLATGLLKGQKS